MAFKFIFSRCGGFRRQPRSNLRYSSIASLTSSGKGMVRSLRPLTFTRKTQRPWFHLLSDKPQAAGLGVAAGDRRNLRRDRLYRSAADE